jgi:hypothetical protein
METINLLAHSTYNVEQIRKNREFFASLLDQIERTYAIYRKSTSGINNRINVEFGPKPPPRITNVYIRMEANGVIEFTFSSIRFYHVSEEKKEELLKKYENSAGGCGGHTVYIKGVTYDNYKEHLANIVVCIEGADYSFK